MVNKFFFICTIILSILTINMLFLFKNRTSLLSPIDSSITISTNNEDSIIKIIIIGDSWAENAKEYKMPQILDSILNINNIACNIIAKGQYGATSRDIYINLCTEIEKFNYLPDIAIVSCGINDSHGQYGSNFYAYHTSLILQKLLELKITPILIELPYYNISSQYKYYPTYKQFAYHALSILTDFNLEINNIERYRKKLRNTLNKQKIEKNVNVISIDSFPNTYYNDYMHLNAFGYYKLSEYVANIIIRS